MHGGISVRVCGVFQGLISSFPSFGGLQWGNKAGRTALCSPCPTEQMCRCCEGQGCSTRCKDTELLLAQNSPSYHDRNPVKKVASPSAVSWWLQLRPVRAPCRMGSLLGNVCHWLINDRQEQKDEEDHEKTTGKPSTNSSASTWGFKGSYFHEISCYLSMVDIGGGKDF